jgi:hypothetical protein
MDWQEVQVFSLNVQGVWWSTLTELWFTNDQILYLSQAIERTIVVSQVININFTSTCENRAADPGESKECAAQEIRLKCCADPPHNTTSSIRRCTRQTEQPLSAPLDPLMVLEQLKLC